MTNGRVNLYRIYQERKNEILSIAKDQQSIIKQLGLGEIQSEGEKPCEVKETKLDEVGANLDEVLNGIIKKLQSDTLKVFVIGRFNSGKSTFINALFGQPILPSAPTPTTGVLCKIKYADDKEKKAILYPKPGMSKNGDDSPFEVPISNIQEELKKYVKIDNSGTADETSRYQKLKLYYPFSLCKNDIEIIDSVGLDDPESRDKIVLEYIPYVDVIVYCMDCLSAYTRADTKVLNLLKSLKYESIFFVMTKFDLVKDSFQMGETTENDFKNDIYKNLIPWTELREQGIMFVDSKSALLGKMNHNEVMIQSSGICEVEQSLELFLIREKGRAKLLNTLRSLKDANRSTRRIIPSRISMLQTNIEELEKRYKDAELPLTNLELKRKLMIQHFDVEITKISRNACDMTTIYCTELPAKIKNWSLEYEPKSQIGFPPNKADIEIVASEVVNYLKEKIEEDAINWNNCTLSPMIESRMKEMMNSLEAQYRDFINSIELVRVEISKGEKLNNEEIAEQKEAPLSGRLVSVGDTLLTDNFISGEMGAFGTEAIFSALILEMVAGAMLSLLGLLDPFTLVLSVIAAILGGGFLRFTSLKDGIKKAVGEKLAEEIQNHQSEICNNAESKIIESLRNRRDILDSALTSEISNVRGEVEIILKKKASGKLNIEEETKKLRDLESKNNLVEEEIDKLFYETGITEKGINPLPVQTVPQV